MRILIEEHKYPATDEILKVVSELGPTIGVGGYVSVGYVGYYYNASIKDCVFILPKVLMDENEMAFGNYKPEDIVDLEAAVNPLEDKERRFIYELAVWIYRAICVYKERHPKSEIVLHERISEYGKGQRRQSNTFLDILLALLQFNKDNQDFFFFIIKNLHSGHNKINWTRTISHSQAYVQTGTPIYLRPVNKRRQVNFDEELMVIFFSILNYIHKVYGFPFDTECHYELINDQLFRSYLKGMGKARLQEIKYKYFSDKALELWDLCYAFFEHAPKIIVNTKQKEYLLVKSFQIVFEDIIDELIGSKDIPKDLMEQQDGKRVDHMYRYTALTESNEENIYYIGDSKYYKRKTPIGGESVYKQFTYARNVIQWNLNLFLDDKRKEEQDEERRKGIGMLRDDVMEGYNVIPNFFISAQQNDLEMHSDITLKDEEKDAFSSRQFNNRLFDRDTLLIAHYDVNFLYVVSLYGRKNEGMKRGWQKKVRELFRRNIQDMLNKRFQFHIMTPFEHIDGEEVLRANFKDLLGKVFQPYPDSEIGQHYYSLALARPESIEDDQLRRTIEIENMHVIDLVDSYFDRRECRIGEDKRDELIKYDIVMPSSAKRGVLLVMMENYEAKSPQFLPSGIIAVGIKYQAESMKIVENLKEIGFILFHHRSDLGQHLFAVKNECVVVDKGKLDSSIYKNINTADVYIVVQLDSENELDSSSLHSNKLSFTPQTRYDAQFSMLSDLAS